MNAYTSLVKFTQSFNWALRCSIHVDLNLPIVHDDDGVHFREATVCEDVVELALLSGSIKLFWSKGVPLLRSEDFTC